MSKWTLADVEKIGLDRLVRPPLLVTPPSAPTSKYHAKVTIVDGERFASKKEARRWNELRVLQHAGQLHDLRRQPRFELHAGPQQLAIGEWWGDFQYCACDTPLDCRGTFVIEDTKGFRTALYRWKKAHFEAEYGMRIHEL